MAKNNVVTGKDRHTAFPLIIFSEIHKIIAMHTKTTPYRLRNVRVGCVLYRALVVIMFVIAARGVRNERNLVHLPQKSSEITGNQQRNQ